jgi:hypothetical protein
VLIIRRSKFNYTASGIITLCRWPSGAQVERSFLATGGEKTSLTLCTGRPPTGVMIPDAVLYNSALLMMST